MSPSQCMPSKRPVLPVHMTIRLHQTPYQTQQQSCQTNCYHPRYNQAASCIQKWKLLTIYHHYAPTTVPPYRRLQFLLGCRRFSLHQ